MDYTYGARSVVNTRSSQTVMYQELEHPCTKRGKCPDCGKSRSRSNRFTMTMSPFNKDPETDLPRTARQIQAALRALAQDWVPDFSCASHEYVAVIPSIVGTAEDWETVYRRLSWRLNWRGAQREGFAEDVGDDFVIVCAEGDRVLRVTDADRQPLAQWEPSQFADVAASLGMTWAGNR
jgi:hypothetical protein